MGQKPSSEQSQGKNDSKGGKGPALNAVRLAIAGCEKKKVAKLGGGKKKKGRRPQSRTEKKHE